MQGEGPTIFVLCVAGLAVLATVAKHFINASGPTCTVVCLRAEGSGDVTVSGPGR